jgi:peptidyl-prolyl cis-trans isomerase D
MLQAFRSASGSIVVKLLLGLLVLSFAVWGISGSIFTGVGNGVVTAGQTSVSVLDYRLAYDRQIQAISQQFGTQITREQAQAFGLDQQVMSQVVSGALLDEQAREMDLGLSEDRLAELTAEDPAFQDANGNFNRSQFEFVLRQVGMRPQDYFRNREQVAKRQQIVHAVTDGLPVPEAFLTAYALYDGEARTVDTLTLPASLVQPIEDPDAATLEAYFEENKATYAAPEYRRISYFPLDPETIADPAAVEESEIERYYADNSARYTQPERRTIQQIVFPNAEEAQAALERIRGGETYDAIATELGRSEQDLLLGTFARDQVVDPAIAEAAFELDQGEVSEVVSGMFGSILVRVTEIAPEQVAPLAEVSQEIRDEIALDRAAEDVRNFYDSYEDARAGGSGMREAAESLGLEVREIPAIDRNGLSPEGEAIETIPEQQAMLTEAFESEAGIENPPLNAGPVGYVFYEVEEVIAPRDRTLDEVRERVLEDWRTAEIATRLSARADELEARLTEGASLADLATELGLTVETQRGLSRDSSSSSLGPDGLAAVFGVPQGASGSIAAPDGASQILFVVSEVVQPMSAGPDAVPQDLAERLRTGMADDLLDQLVARLQTVYPVRVNQAAVDQALSF